MEKKGDLVATRPESIIEARFSLTAKQNDIIDMAFTQIKNDETVDYILNVNKYKKIYMTDTSNIYRDFEKAAKSLEGKGFYIVDDKEKNEAKREKIFYVWFSKIHYKPGLGEIEVRIDKDVKLMFIEVKKRIYYHLRYSLNLKCDYSKRIYFYLKSFVDTGWRVDILDELRTKLMCPKSYSKYSDFKRFVLNPAYEEINDITDIKFEYEPIKTGRKVTHIKWIIQSYEVPLKDEKLNTKLIHTIKDIIKEDLTAIDCVRINSAAGGDLNLIREKYKAVCKYAKNNTVINVAATLIDAIKNWKDPKDIKTPSTFNNFKGREYTGEQLNYFVDKLTAYQDQEVLKQADCITCVLFQKDKCMLKKQPDENGMCTNYNERIVKND